MKEQIIALLQKVRPALQADGGDVEFVDFNEGTGVVTVKLKGACGSCPMATMTLKNGIERYLKEAIPQITSVEKI
ncbi:NifU family protein [Candidatus Proelusimicrobium excrementi]|uniref:NifU family protein n=1 Tax=Candidatus Proelusimicrobium excrementi TaxID=3416222 RepID=UPI003CA9376C|nr:NifU family protein [Elusimicrobiaceae bacterium]